MSQPTSSEARQPQWLECGACQHTWIGVYLPLPADVAARLYRAARCPMCAGKPKYVYEAGHTPEGQRAPGPPAPLYFRTVEDFHRLRDEQLRPCLQDFLLWLAMVRSLPEIVGSEVFSVKNHSTFGWVEDGRHDCNFDIRFSVEPTGESVTVTEPDGTQHVVTRPSQDETEGADGQR